MCHKENILCDLLKGKSEIKLGKNASSRGDLGWVSQQGYSWLGGVKTVVKDTGNRKL